MALSTLRQKLLVLGEAPKVAALLQSALTTVNEWRQSWVDNEFNLGAADAFVQADVPGESFEILHLTPALLEEFRVICATVVGSLSASQRATLRKIARSILRGQGQ